MRCECKPDSLCFPMAISVSWFLSLPASHHRTPTQRVGLSVFCSSNQYAGWYGDSRKSQGCLWYFSPCFLWAVLLIPILSLLSLMLLSWSSVFSCIRSLFCLPLTLQKICIYLAVLGLSGTRNLNFLVTCKIKVLYSLHMTCKHTKFRLDKYSMNEFGEQMDIKWIFQK